MRLLFTPLIRRALPALLLSVSAFAGHAGQTGDAIALGPDPVISGGDYSTGGGITVALELREIGGRTGICGAWAQSERLTAYVRGKGREVLSKGKVLLGGSVLHHDLRFLRRVAPAESYAGAPANCIRTARPWAGAAGRMPRVRIPRQLVVLERSSGGGGLEIRFRQSDGTNPAMKAGSLLPARWTTFRGKPERHRQRRPNQ